jgi:hypothetical protein
MTPLLAELGMHVGSEKRDFYMSNWYMAQLNGSTVPPSVTPVAEFAYVITATNAIGMGSNGS